MVLLERYYLAMRVFVALFWKTFDIFTSEFVTLIVKRTVIGTNINDNHTKQIVK